MLSFNRGENADLDLLYLGLQLCCPCALFFDIRFKLIVTQGCRFQRLCDHEGAVLR
jgi:hypothetical protein